MEKILQPDQWDIIREAAIVLVGFIIRFLEKRKMKKENGA